MTPDEIKIRAREKSAVYYKKNREMINAKRRVAFKNAYQPQPRQASKRRPIDTQESYPAESPEAITLRERFHKFRKLSRK